MKIFHSQTSNSGIKLVTVVDRVFLCIVKNSYTFHKRLELSIGMIAKQFVL